MADMTDSTQTLKAIQVVMARAKGDSDRFAETLRHEGIPHLSFSQVTTVEFCQYRYFLQYVQLQDPTPAPDYFTKGKLLHQILAAYYEKLAQNQDFTANEYYQQIDQQYQGISQRHLRNALAVHLQHPWQDCEVVAVEKPFAMSIHPDLPPCVGVIDLILKKSGRFVIVDHKTGHDFYPQDQLQMAIYVQYVQQQFDDAPCEFYYDHYRWVNNLARIRKPAFQRTGVTLSTLNWQAALERIRAGSAVIERIKHRQWAARNGPCYRCPYRKTCHG